MADRQLLYSGNHLHALMQDLDTEVVVIAFNNRGELPAEGRYWGDRFFEKLGISSVGVVARKANWFPSEEMQEAAAFVREHVRGRRVITYGTSMGGYGALKFSKLLDAAVALAFSPQWSNNPAEIGDFDHRWSAEYDPSNRGGDAIRADDLHGRCFVFLDPYERLDRLHAERLGCFPEVERVLAPYTWHGSLLQLTTSKGGEGRRLIEYACDPHRCTARNFRQLFRSSRKTSSWYREVKLNYLAGRLETGHIPRYQELRRLCAETPTQEARLLQAVITFLDGDEDIALAAVRAEAQTGLHDIHITALERVQRIYRNRRFVKGELLLASGIRDRDRSDVAARLGYANVLVSLNLIDEAVADVAALCRDLDVRRHRAAIASFAERTRHPELLALAFGDDVLFAGEHVTAVARMTDADTVLLVFDSAAGRRFGEFEESGFYLQNGTSSIGIFSPSGFPPGEMTQAIAAIRKRTAGKRVVSLGKGMGGYAAFKNARASGAELTVAFAPLWSANPTEIDAFDHRPHAFNAETGAGGRVETADFAGRGVIIIDPREATDRSHALRLAQLGSVEIVPAPFTWGEPARAIFDGQGDARKSFADLLMTPEAANRLTLRQSIRAGRRSSGHYQVVKFYTILSCFERTGHFRSALGRLAASNIAPDWGLAGALTAYLDGSREAAAERLAHVVHDPNPRYDARRFWQLFRQCGWHEGALAIARAVCRPSESIVDHHFMLVQSLVDSGLSDEASVSITEMQGRFDLKADDARLRAIMAKIAGPSPGEYQPATSDPTFGTERASTIDDAERDLMLAGAATLDAVPASTLTESPAWRFLRDPHAIASDHPGETVPLPAKTERRPGIWAFLRRPTRNP